MSRGLETETTVTKPQRVLPHQEYNTKSPLNGLAAKWAVQNAHLLPIDPRPVAPPLRTLN